MKVLMPIDLTFLYFCLVCVVASCADERSAGGHAWVCGETLCNWEVTAGDTELAPTWHQRDYGVEMVGYPVEIFYTDTAIVIGGNCLVFELIAYVEIGADVVLEADYWNDGVIEVTRAVQTKGWERMFVEVPDPPTYEGFRIIIRKQGEGKAVFAKIEQYRRSYLGDCEEPLEGTAPKGWSCSTSDECVSRECGPTSREVVEGVSPYACGDCSGDEDCPEEEICGLLQTEEPLYLSSPASGTPYPGCVQPASRTTGQVCVRDEECADGYCSWYGLDIHYGRDMKCINRSCSSYDYEIGTCQKCRSDSDCGSDMVCGLSLQGDRPVAACVQPGLDAFGEPCLSNLECADGLVCKIYGTTKNRCGFCELDTECDDDTVCSDEGDCIEPG